MDTIINPEEMQYIEQYLDKGISGAKGMKESVESLRAIMANMYEGQAYDDLQDSFHKLRSQYLMIENSYTKLKTYVSQTHSLFHSQDEFSEDRVNAAVEEQKKNQSGG